MASQQALINVLSNNIKGLNIPEKRSNLLKDLQKRNIHVTLLQETHFRSDSIPKLTYKYYPTHFLAPNQVAKSKGVSILLHKDLDFSLSDSLTDPEGRYIFIKGLIGDSPVTFANIYAPKYSPTILHLQDPC